jgi:hypothetical protein
METNEELKKEIASLKRRLTSALKQRDDWAMKYAKVMESLPQEKNLKISFDIADRNTNLDTQ